MKLSADGRVRIQNYEGYHEALPDGSCKAYQKTYNGKKDKWTIGFGSTEDVYEGLIWTRAQAEAAFDQDVEKFETAVTRLATVEINQNQFDALVSFAYNVGLGGRDENGKKIPGFSNSTLLRKLNKGDYEAAADQFQYWNHVNGRPVSGLTERRYSEANLFRKPIAATSLPSMPQTVSKAREPLSEKAAATVSAGLTVGTVEAAPKAMDLLSSAEQIVSTGQRVHGVAEGGRALSAWALSLANWPYLLGAAVLGAGLYWLICHYLPSKQGEPS